MSFTMTRMLKRIALAVLIFCMSALFVAVKADAEELFEYRQGYYTYTVTDSKATVVKVADTVSGSLSIPARLGGNTVVGISSTAFDGCNKITSLTIPDNVESIGEGAFRYCTAMERFVVSGSAKAFYTDSDGVLYNKDKTHIIAFPSECSKASFTIAAEVTTLEKYAFYNCNNLVSFSVSTQNKSFSADGYGVLYNYDKTELIRYPQGNERTDYTVSSGVEGITENAFYGCDNLKSIHFEGTQQQWESIVNGLSDESELRDKLHTVTFTDASAAGCENDGYSEGAYCSKCEKWLYGHEKTESASGHVFEKYISDSNATCTKDGTKTAKCENCSATDTVTDEGSALNHKNAETVDGTKAGCVTDGLSDGKFCPDCNTWLIRQQTIPASGHTFENYTSDNNSTYFSDGTKTAGCSNCSETDTIADKGTKLKLGVTQNITAVSDVSSIKLNWQAVTDATGYRVYLYNKGWKLAETVQGLEHEFEGLDDGIRYSFAVKAITTENGKTALSPSFLSLSAYTKPTPPQNVKASAVTDKSITLNWSRCTGATGYRIYVKNANKWKSLKTTTALSYTVTALSSDTAYTFALRPYIKSGKDYIWAKSYTEFNISTKLSACELTAVSSSGGRVTFTWSDITGESGYQLWYSETKNGKYSKVSNYKAGTTRKTVGGFLSGKTCYFKLRAYKKTGSGYSYSNFSAVKAVKIK